MFWPRTVLSSGVSIAISACMLVLPAAAQSPIVEASGIEESESAIAGDDDFSFLQKEDKSAQPKPVTPTPAAPAQKPGATPAAPRQPGEIVPPPPAPPAQPAPAPNPFVNQPNRSFLARMSRAPDMFGDSYMPAFLSVQIDLGTPQPGDSTLQLSVPSAGGGGRFKNEYARALPTDRVFGIYHHFENVIDINAGPGFANQSRSLDRYTIGFEKTFDDGNASIELRLPMTGTVGFASPDVQFRSDNVGDLVIGFKRLLFVDEQQGLAAGLAVSAPTGADFRVNFPTVASSITFENNAVYLLPYLAYQATPTDEFFLNAYGQIDVAASQNAVTFRDIAGTTRLPYSDQTLLYLDFSLGYWLFQTDADQFLTGVAGLVEVHYTTALNEPGRTSELDGKLSLEAPASRFDVVNMTVGTHWQFGPHTSLRVGAVFPLRDNPNRFFDSEIAVALVYRR